MEPASSPEPVLMPNILFDVMTTKTGCLIICVFKLFQTLFASASATYFLNEAELFAQQQTWCALNEGATREEHIVDCTQQAFNYAMAKLGSILSATLGIMYIIQAACLCYGTYRKRLEYLFPFALVETPNAIAMLLFIFASFTGPVFAAPLFAIFLGLGIYALFVVRWHLDYLYEDRIKRTS